MLKIASILNFSLWDLLCACVLYIQTCSHPKPTTGGVTILYFALSSLTTFPPNVNILTNKMGIEIGVSY